MCNSKIPSAEIETKVVYANRDPTFNDESKGATLWISSEYEPNRVFQGYGDSWIFVGKFYRQKA